MNGLTLIRASDKTASTLHLYDLFFPRPLPFKYTPGNVNALPGTCHDPLFKLDVGQKNTAAASAAASLLLYNIFGGLVYFFLNDTRQNRRLVGGPSE